jgi:acetyl esterase/lipase
VAVAAVEYTLSRPGAPSWPINRDDARAAVRWVRSQARTLGIDPARCAVLGASAGGHLAALTALEADDPTPLPVVAFYAPTDLTTLSGPVADDGGPVALLLGGTLERPAIRARAEAASPRRMVRPGGPPMLLIHGLRDEVIPPSQSRAMAEALDSARISHEMILLGDEAHGFGLDAGGRDLAAEILAFLTRTWDDPLRAVPPPG